MIELSYIQSSGTQYIDTGIPANTANLKFVMDIEITGIASTSSQSGDGILGGSWAVNGYLLIRFGSSPGVLRWHSGGRSGDVPVALNTRYTIETGTSYFKVNDVTYNLTGSIGTNVSNNVTLFYRTIGSTGSPGIFKLYNCKVYSDDTLIADLIPVKDDNDVVCLYDVVRETYYRNSGTGDFIPGEPLTPSYTVAFNANGGAGAMTTQSIEIDTPTPLSLNTFTRNKYQFVGWSRTPTGAVEYHDGEIVYNIAQADETVTLYAIWERLPMSIELQSNTSEHNKVDKEITSISTLPGTLRAETSLTDPVIIVEGDLSVIASANYLTISDFGRSYYITGYRSIRKNLTEISCHVDVLYTYRDTIRQQRAIISKQENDWNLYLNDGSLKTYQNADVLTKMFPSGFNTQEFVLAIAGD